MLLYKSDSDLENAYHLVHTGMGDTKEVRSFATNTVLTDSALIPANDLLFIECRALVHIRMSDSTDSITAYAKRLDKRLNSLVCQ